MVLPLDSLGGVVEGLETKGVEFLHPEPLPFLEELILERAVVIQVVYAAVPPEVVGIDFFDQRRYFPEGLSPTQNGPWPEGYFWEVVVSSDEGPVTA